MPSPDMMAQLGIQGQPSGDGGQGMGGPMAMLQNPQFLQSLLQRSQGGQPGGMPSPGGMRQPMPMPSPSPAGPMPGGAPMGGQQKPGMMGRFGQMAATAGPQISNMLMADEDRKKEALRYR